MVRTNLSIYVSGSTQMETQKPKHVSKLHTVRKRGVQLASAMCRRALHGTCSGENASSLRIRSAAAMCRRDRCCACASWWTMRSSTAHSPGRCHMLSPALVPAANNVDVDLELHVAGVTLHGSHRRSLVAGTSLLSCSIPRPRTTLNHQDN
jgi:hypothetical protein